MKNTIMVIGFLVCTSLFSQQNSAVNDIIMTTDGRLLQVKVIKVTEDTVSFNYPGESVTNEVKSAGINKIVFASGRTQNFNGTPANTSEARSVEIDENVSIYQKEQVIATPKYEENTLAIVPLKFTRNGGYNKTLSNDATDYVGSLTSKGASTKGIKVLDKGTAIEKLVDAGVNYDKLRQSSPKELREVLGTEYLLYISIDEEENKKMDTTVDYMDTIRVDKSVNDKGQLERNISLKVYGAASDLEAYEVDFFESIFNGKSSGENSTLLANGKWKSSLRYLTDQLFTSNVFTD